MKRVDIENAPGFLDGRIAHHLKLNIGKLLSEADIQLSAKEVTILTALSQLDSARSMASLAELLGRDPTTLKRQLSIPIKKGLLNRKTSGKDRRVVEISTTAKQYKLHKMSNKPFHCISHSKK